MEAVAAAWKKAQMARVDVEGAMASKMTLQSRDSHHPAS
jgi:hypothetical protein